MTFARYLEELSKNLDTYLELTWDYKDTGEQSELEVELPGVEKKDLSITVKERTLTIEATRRGEHCSKHFVIPTNVDTDKITAALKNGVLTLRLPRKEEHNKGRAIAVD